MTEGTRIVGLILIMMAAVSVSTAVAIKVLYGTAFEQERRHLEQNADDQAHLMEAVARMDQVHHGDFHHLSDADALRQIQRAFEHYPSDGQIAEIAVARREGDKIVYLVTHGRPAANPPAPVPLASTLAEPMRQALSGHSGSMIGLDYRGVQVLAAFQPIAMLNAGVVAKMDLASLRAPFLRGAGMVIGLALALVTTGTVLFVRLTNPIIRHLTETEQRYQRIFRGAPVAIWEQDLSGVTEALQELKRSGVADLKRYLAEHRQVLEHVIGKIRVKEANAAALRLFRARSTRQFIAWFESALLPAIVDICADGFEGLCSQAEALLSRTVSVKTRDGKDLTVLLSTVIPNADHNSRSTPVSALDVTADVQLRRREEELHLIMTSTGEGIFGLDGRGRCSFVNRAALRMLGYQDENDLLGREMHALIHHRCRNGTPLPPEGCPIVRACCQEAAVRLEDEELSRADGTSFPAEYRSYPMRRDGTVVGTVVTFTDITERKAREAEFLHSQKMEVVGQLTGGIAHDFSNLITIILTNLHMLEEQLGESPDGEIHELLADAGSAAQDAASLTRRLLAFSRRQRLEPQYLELDAFLDHTCRFLRRLTGKGIELVLRCNDGPLRVHVDRQQLENAILNLTINARDAMPDGGTLTIETRRQPVRGDGRGARDGPSPGPYVVISITDTGVGMSAEEVRRAVEPFYSTKPIGKGSGLGLSTALGFAQQSGGDLEISSTPGEGTTVSLYLPEAAPTEDERIGSGSPSIPAQSVVKNTRILVVDDEERARRLACKTLSELGYDVLEACDASAAMAALEKDTQVDLLFTDIVMPGGMDGRELALWALQQRPGLKVLLTSGFFRQAAAAEPPDADALPFLNKPYSKRQLEGAIQDLLSAPMA